MKVCTMCKQIFPATLEYFYAHNARGKDGLHSECKSCISKRGKLYREANRVKCAERARSYYDEHKEDLLAYRKNWWDEHKENINQERKFRRGSTSKITESIQERRRRYRHERRARMSTGSGYTTEQWRELCKLFNNKCVGCDSDKVLTVDHIIPLSRGGLNSITNIQPLCHSCNSKKHTKSQDFTSDLILSGCDPEGIF